MKTKKRKTKPIQSYKPTVGEIDAIKRQIARQRSQPSIRLKASEKDGQRIISVDHAIDSIGRALLYDALSTADPDFLFGLLSQMSNGGYRGREVSDDILNFMLSVIKGGKAKDQFETMLMAQMAAVHIATMRSARELEMAPVLPQADMAGRTFNNLARTFAMQLETLKRYRSGGEQKVTVQHVSVNEGGQAIVGNVTRAPRQKATGKPTNYQAAIADAKSAPMPTINEKGGRISISRSSSGRK
jgi:hypothetical protein